MLIFTSKILHYLTLDLSLYNTIRLKQHYRSTKPKNGMNKNDLVNNSQFVTQNVLFLLLLLLVVVVVVTAAGVVVVMVMMICFTRGKGHQYQLYRRLGGPPDLVWTFQLEKKTLVPAGIQSLDRPTHSLVTIRIMLSQL